MMAAPTAGELLTLWEQCLPLSPIGRAVAMLELTRTDEAHDAVAAWPIGVRDTHLLRLRARAFGGRLTGITPCPMCGETVELTIEANDLLTGGAATVAADVEELTVDRDGYHVAFRLPSSADLAALDGATPDVDLERALLSRCLWRAELNGSPVDADDLPDAVVDAVAGSMAANDPLAQIEFACTCPACCHAWLAVLDVPAFIWAELDDFAKHLLRDIHVLASGYGWPEADILALTPTRRQIYLDLVTG